MGKRKGRSAILLYLPEELHQGLRAISKNTGRSMQFLGNRAITKLVRSWEERMREKAERKKQGTAKA